MSQAQIDRLKTFLLEEGYVENENFRVEPADRGGDAVTISVDIPIDVFELPEELKPFEQDHEDVDRAIWKGNTEKKTWEGANYELALRAYGGSILEKNPEFKAINARIRSDIPGDMPTLEEYEALKSRLWGEIWAEPKHAAWEHDLDTNHF